MKTALAIVCSLLLAWTNLVFAQAPEASVTSAAISCHCGGKRACCAAKHSTPEPLPVSAAPTFSSQNPLSLMLYATVAWALPENGPAHNLPASSSLSLKPVSDALFARDCAWLI